MINNGSMHYDHDRDGTHTMIGGCEVKFRNFAHDTFINIRYENDVITVTHDLDNKRAWEPCLRVEGVKLPTGYYFGASAATGMNNIRTTLDCLISRYVCAFILYSKKNLDKFFLLIYKLKTRKIKKYKTKSNDGMP